MFTLPLLELESPSRFPIYQNFQPGNAVTLHEGETLAFLKTIPGSVVDLVITSPPYNIGKAYERKQSIEQYLEEQDTVIEQLVRILSDGGSLCWQIGNYVDGGEVFPLDILFYPLFKRLGLKLRNRIVWRFEHGLHASKRFSGRYETLLWFTKTDDYTFNLDPIRVPAKYPGKRHFKGPNKGLPSGNPLGKNPSDYWGFLCDEWEEAVWNIPNVKANHVEKTIHPCQFPVELVERCVLALTNPDDLVLDPFCGVGSSLIAALMHGRRAAGVDKEQSYVSIAQSRITQLDKGMLKTRPLGQPVHQPTGRERVAQVPLEWQIDGEQ